MTAADVAAKFHAIARGKGWLAKCPIHDDSTASLSIDPGEHGGVLVKCRAGCAFTDVLAAAGLTVKDVQPAKDADLTIQAVYDYRDERGALLYQVVRYLPKTFKQRRPDGAGGHVWSLTDVRRVLYRLPDLKGKARVWFVEGEKDADRLATLGLASTTFAGGGSAKWLPDYTAQLLAAGVTELCVIPDNDATGLKVPEAIAKGTRGSALTVRPVLLPGVKPKGDVSDWLNAGHTRAELEALSTKRPTLSRSTAPTLLDLERNDRNIPKSNLANAVAVLQQDPLWGPDYLYFDEFLERVITVNPTPQSWRDADDTRFAVYLQQTIGMSTISEAQAASAVRYVASQRPRHCVREHVRREPWDDIQRIAHVLEDFFGVTPSSDQPCEYVRAVSANLFIGMVARIERPGCQLDTMVILEGAQGIGKSSALRILGGAWYALGAESVTSKDFFQTIPGKWLIELGELDSIGGRAERERIKIAISTPIDRYRASYGRHAADHPRQCVFVGTTNRDDYGHDDTGLRRFWPVRCGAIDLAGLAAAAPQLFAEALAAYRLGATWWEVPGEAAAGVQRDRQAEDIWTAPILAWCLNKPNVTSAEIASGALSMRAADMDRATQTRISHVLKLAKWTRKTIRRPGEEPVKGFIAPESAPDM